MSGAGLLDGLAEARAAVEAAKAAVDSEIAGRDRIVREALAAGVPVAQIVEASGLSRARVYQVRDGVR